MKKLIFFLLLTATIAVKAQSGAQTLIQTSPVYEQNFTMREHIVMKDESLALIAAMYGEAISTVLADNPFLARRAEYGAYGNVVSCRIFPYERIWVRVSNFQMQSEPQTNVTNNYYSNGNPIDENFYFRLMVFITIILFATVAIIVGFMWRGNRNVQVIQAGGAYIVYAEPAQPPVFQHEHRHQHNFSAIPPITGNITYTRVEPPPAAAAGAPPVEKQ